MADDEKRAAAAADAAAASTPEVAKEGLEKTDTKVAIPLGELGADVADVNVDIEDALSKLPDHEAAILRKQIQIPDNKSEFLPSRRAKYGTRADG